MEIDLTRSVAAIQLLITHCIESGQSPSQTTTNTANLSFSFISIMMLLMVVIFNLYLPTHCLAADEDNWFSIALLLISPIDKAAKERSAAIFVFSFRSDVDWELTWSVQHATRQAPIPTCWIASRKELSPMTSFWRNDPYWNERSRWDLSNGFCHFGRTGCNVHSITLDEFDPTEPLPQWQYPHFWIDCLSLRKPSLRSFVPTCPIDLQRNTADLNDHWIHSHLF